MQKIRSIHEVARELGKPAPGRGKVVQCHGVFDLLHIGHIRHLQQARELGDRLVVTLTPDRFVNKGPHRPAFSDDLRAEALAALECVDFVCISDWPTAVEAIRLISPDVFMKGVVGGTGPRDRDNAIDLEREAIESVGGRLVLSDTELSSASKLINRHTDVFSPQLKSFLRQFRSQFSAEQLVATLSQFAQLRILVVGESFVEFGGARGDIGPTSDDRGSERYVGGAMAVANTLSQFSDRIALLTLGIGDEVSAGFLSKNVAPGIELEIANEAALAEHGVERSLDRMLDRMLDRHDIVLLSDQGSGFVGTTARAMIRARASFFAVDSCRPASQASRDSSGCGPDLVVQRHACPEPTNLIANRITEQHACGLVLLICGGALDSSESAVFVCDAETASCVEVPGFPVNKTNRVDALGTREALFALAAPCRALGLSAVAVGFIGNLAAAAATMTAGSGRALEPRLIYRHIDSLLK